uniref:Uncharacterized protein n=1 Tax=Rhizophora mucronata TaxID=61149 RepID=A0A2P2QP12_RHIMU
MQGLVGQKQVKCLKTWKDMHTIAELKHYMI